MYKRFFVAALALLALTSINAQRTNAQSSCPNSATFGVRQSVAVNKSLQSQIEVTYFTTDDPNVFISEKAGLKRSASYIRLNTNQFVAKIGQLQRDGLASIKKKQSSTSYLGEMAELNLERNSSDARVINASMGSSSLEFLSGLDRQSEISVSKGSSIDGNYYRVNLLSWFVDVTAKGGQKVVDYDSSVLLTPGETAVFKLSSDYEVKRSGAARSYIAITMRSVNSVGLASLGRQR
ncbi:MAG TPA: hypothetical protein VF708_02585 [Pyrinomonadaceae bacterium]|jgi:hypothetical protein